MFCVKNIAGCWVERGFFSSMLLFDLETVETFSGFELSGKFHSLSKCFCNLVVVGRVVALVTFLVVVVVEAVVVVVILVVVGGSVVGGLSQHIPSHFAQFSPEGVINTVGLMDTVGLKIM